MDHPQGGATSPPTVVALVAVAFLANDVPDAQPAELAAASQYVDDSVAAMPDVTRAGVRLASGAAYLVLSLLGGSPYRRQSRASRSHVAGRVAAVSLPVLSELNRLSRGLALVSIYEQRFRNGSL